MYLYRELHVQGPHRSHKYREKRMYQAKSQILTSASPLLDYCYYVGNGDLEYTAVCQCCSTVL